MFSKQLAEMEDYYNAKEITTERDENIKRNLTFFKTNFELINIANEASDKGLKKGAAFINEELKLEPEYRSKSLNKSLSFLLHNGDSPESFELSEQWLRIIYFYVLDVLESKSRNQ